LTLPVAGIVADPPGLPVTVTDPGLVRDGKIREAGDTRRLFWMKPSCQALLSVNVPISGEAALRCHAALIYSG
jgi:hypothetical protein